MIDGADACQVQLSAIIRRACARVRAEEGGGGGGGGGVLGRGFPGPDGDFFLVHIVFGTHAAAAAAFGGAQEQLKWDGRNSRLRSRSKSYEVID